MAEKIVKDQGLAKELVNDCISRKAALDALEKSKEIYFDRQVIIGAMKDIVRNLPSAQPKSYREGYQAGFKDAQLERKRGKWVFYEDRAPVWDIAGEKTWARAYKCSECGFVHSVIEDFGQYAFCPNCGADMRGETDE